MSANLLRVLTWLSWEIFIELGHSFTSLRNTLTRTVIQPLIIMLLKLRTGNSTTVTVNVLGLSYEQQVSLFFNDLLKVLKTIYCFITV